MRYESTKLADRKSLLAKLLAAENINIQHTKTKTAYFDLKSRTLNCPIWEDMDEKPMNFILFSRFLAASDAFLRIS